MRGVRAMSKRQKYQSDSVVFLFDERHVLMPFFLDLLVWYEYETDCRQNMSLPCTGTGDKHQIHTCLVSYIHLRDVEASIGRINNMQDYQQVP